jgi:hypothetical protein
VIKFVIAYWDSILIVLAVIVLLMLSYKKHGSKYINEVLFYLVTKAEQQYGGGTGELKYAAVVDWLFERIPFVLRILFTKKQIDHLIETAVIKMKEYLKANECAAKLIAGTTEVLTEETITKVGSGITETVTKETNIV